MPAKAVEAKQWSSSKPSAEPRSKGSGSKAGPESKARAAPMAESAEEATPSKKRPEAKALKRPAKATSFGGEASPLVASMFYPVRFCSDSILLSVVYRM